MVGVDSQLADGRRRWHRLTSSGGALHGLPGGLDGLDAAVDRLGPFWAGEVDLLGDEARPQWAGSRLYRDTRDPADTRLFGVLDALAVRSGDLLVGLVDRPTVAWAEGTGLDSGCAVVRDAETGAEMQMVGAIFADLFPANGGRLHVAPSVLLRTIAGRLSPTDEDRARAALESAHVWERYVLRAPRRGVFRRAVSLSDASARQVLAALGPGGVLGDGPDPVSWYDPGAGWWTAAAGLERAPEGDGVAAVVVHVVGGPEDSQVGTDPGNLGLFLARVRRVAAEHGLELDRTLGPGRSWDDDPSPSP
ncbi:hypothetical protein [Phycicoccus flavus]|uniref:hypothetical protein n=1 Tax=Phycicoccus flavus TaxID=2502783 RepID=UPI000FEBAA6F|nr:hypothetical protein [Phycicoccus flavus]NHA69644.1 hypothetical protein [Phycicoccus flavus]